MIGRLIASAVIVAMCAAAIMFRNWRDKARK